jgi:methyl-accepting chemotaxis protein
MHESKTSGKGVLHLNFLKKIAASQSKLVSIAKSHIPPLKQPAIIKNVIANAQLPTAMNYPLSLRTKLLIVVAIFSLLSIGIGLVGLQSIKASNDTLRDMYTNRIITLQQLKLMSDALTGNVIDTCHKVSDNHMAWALGRNKLVEGASTIKEQWSNYKNHATTEEEEKLSAQIDGFLGIADGAVTKAVDIMGKTDKKALNAFMIEELYSSLEPVSTKLSELMDLQLELAKREYQAADARYQQLILLFSILIIAGLSVAITLVLFILQRMLRDIRDMVTCVEQVANGNLELSEIPISSNDEIARLATAINSMVTKLRSLVKTVSSSADQVVSSSQQTTTSVEQVCTAAASVASSSTHLASDAAVGTVSVIEVSKSLLELSSLIEIAKREATTAVANSQTTLNTVVESRGTVANTVASMDTIRKKTLETEELIATLNGYIAKIGAITDTITGIALQTNLLALNAAIEAARAGEAGRGFAVVAQEVRKLAEQSTQGASEVVTLIQRVKASTAVAVQAMQGSRSEVEAGVASATQAHKSLDDIFSAVTHTVTGIEGVLSITDEEVTQSDKIIDLIDSLATVIDNTAAQAETVSATSKQTSDVMNSLAENSTATNHLAAKLKTAIEFFKVNRNSNYLEV